MTRKTISDAVTSIDAEYIERAMDYSAKKKTNTHVWIKLTAAAACLAAAVVIGKGFFTNAPADILGEVTQEETGTDEYHKTDILETVQNDFNSFVTGHGTNTTVHYTNIDIEDRTAVYHEVSVEGVKLEEYIGDRYKTADNVTWYIPAGADNLKYLIRNENGGSSTLWVFSDFLVDEGGSYTYGDVLKTIYGVKSADDIIGITTTPSNANNTDLGKDIQEEIGTNEYTERESIETFYKVVSKVICYGEDGGFRGDDTRFTYSFSTDEKDKLTSGESTYGTRFLKVTLKSGTTIDSWKYDALSGCFFEYGGIFTEPLDDEAANKLNNIFGIK